MPVDYYAGGVISYSDLAKEMELGVPAVMIAEHGAVSPEVAAAMADGARLDSRSTSAWR